jgi:hypothetical protein
MNCDTLFPVMKHEQEQRKVKACPFCGDVGEPYVAQKNPDGEQSDAWVGELYLKEPLMLWEG